MIKRILTCAFLLFPCAGAADILVMKNGSQLQGTFDSANTTRMSFTEYNGNRRDININEVQELRFGGQQQAAPRASSGDDRQYDRRPQGAGSALGDSLERLRQDLAAALDNNDVGTSQRQALEDARETLRGAAQQSRNGRPVNQRNIRLALDSIRNNSDRLQRQDRDRLEEDSRRLSASMGGQQGRDY